MKRRAFITGITGQGGSYLAELLLRKGYEVHGLIRRSSTSNMSRIEHLLTAENNFGGRFLLHSADIGDGLRLATLLESIRPHEIYHLAAQSHVPTSFDEPITQVELVEFG